MFFFAFCTMAMPRILSICFELKDRDLFEAPEMSETFDFRELSSFVCSLNLFINRALKSPRADLSSDLSTLFLSFRPMVLKGLRAGDLPSN